MTDALDVSKLTKVFIKIRDERKQIADDFNKRDGELAAKQDMIKSALLNHLQEQNIDSIKTAEGTFFRSTKQKYWTSDWPSMYEFVIENQVPDLLEKRLHQTNMKQYLEDNPDLLPKGLNVDSEYTLSIRKPKK
tara:strand:+ start:342 stop:743 length:402 start_codon:yes stop_codon:yes gene_type:complete